MIAPPTPSKLMKALYDALSPPEPDSSIVNSVLDKLITEIHCRNPVPSPGADWLRAIRFCCQKIGQENPLLLAKCANILLMLISTHHISLTTDDVDFIVSWAVQSLREAPDIVYIDFLQMLDAVIKAEPNYFSTERPELIDVLSSKLEEKSTVSLPLEVTSWRISCLKSLSNSTPNSSLHIIVASYFDIAFSLKKEDPQGYCQIWIKVLEGFEILSVKSSEWIQPVLQHLVVAVHTAMTTGLNVAPSPTLQFPAHIIMPMPAELPPVRPVLKLKKRQRGKGKQVPWPENDRNTQDEGKLQVETQPWVSSSDSEFSDSETGKAKQIKKLEAHVRHSAYNFFIHLVKIVGCKSLLEWYCALLSRLIDAVQAETYSKPRCAVFGALTTFLSGSRTFLAQAQDTEGKAFTSFSEVLAVQLTNLHKAIIWSLKNAPMSDRQQLTALFTAAGVLIKSTPYSRLKKGLFSSLFSNIQTFTASKDRDIISCVLQCLLEIVIINPVSSEVSEAVAAQEDGNDPWLLKYAITYLDEDVNGIRVFAWAVISGLIQYHFTLIEPHAITIENRILQDMSSNKAIVPLLKALTSLLDKYVNDAKYITRAHDIWDKLLEQNSPFLQAVQDPGKPAIVACDCLSLIGSKKFHMLTENKKILIITVVFGCCCSDLQAVRYAALNVLSTLLSFPQMSGEVQFVCDAKDHLIRALKDPVETVRVKAAWAFGYMVDLLVDSKDEELLREVSVFEVLQAALSLTSDTQKVKMNILRAVGHVMLLITEEDLEQPKWKTALDKACNMMQHCATSGSLMKMRWNACYAIATMFSNECLYETLLPTVPSLLQNLCTIVISCNNFKVRINACLALSSIKQRKMYGSLYIFVWQSLLEGLDNAANMPDFSEFKHQHGLLENLCSAVCHMTSFVQPGDIAELKEILDSRLSFLSEHLKQCQERVTPEQAGALLRATSHLENIAKSLPNDVFLNHLLLAFRSAHIPAANSQMFGD